MKNFYLGTDRLAHVNRLDYCMVSVNTLERRKKDIDPNYWILDSGAFTRINRDSKHMPVEEYANQINRWVKCGTLEAAVCQDWMCEPFILQKTGLTVEEHQRRTIQGYDALLPLTEVYVMPVLQGYKPEEYMTHLEMYDDRLKYRAWVGVGSVCKRNRNPFKVVEVIDSILARRPDLLLHLFGIKITTLALASVRDRIYSADSMAWSFNGRYEKLRNPLRSAHNIAEALHYGDKIKKQHVQKQFKFNPSPPEA